jgi:hypothetical protein
MNTDTLAKDLTSSTLYSIKDKLSMLDEKVTSHNQDMAQNLVAINDFCNELIEINKKATNTPQVIQKEVTNECNEKEEQIGKHISHQKAENIRITNELEDLKAAHTDFTAALQICQRKLNELQSKIGIDLPPIKV